jgi:hypothetical protein
MTGGPGATTLATLGAALALTGVVILAIRRRLATATAAVRKRPSVRHAKRGGR